MLQHVYNELASQQTNENVAKWRVDEAIKTEEILFVEYNNKVSKHEQAKRDLEEARINKEKAISVYNKAADELRKAQAKMKEAVDSYSKFVENVRAEKKVIQELDNILTNAKKKASTSKPTFSTQQTKDPTDIVIRDVTTTVSPTRP
ncbi:hypothetical protein AKO1_002112, partial [Acrasis kona]